ncbi:unnamed protein product [Clonostachys rosea f. rosea IK726]|nr:unnamed protein product [Clonostachys rosea f. rosea IK726]
MSLAGMDRVDHNFIANGVLRSIGVHSDVFIDTSIYSPSELEHWFKYMLFEADITADTLDQYL